MGRDGRTGLRAFLGGACGLVVLAAAVGAAELDDLRARLGSDGVREALAELGRKGATAAPAIPDVARVLNDHSEVGTRRLAARTLGEIGTAAAVLALRDALADPPVSSAAAAALGTIGPPARTAIPALVARLHARYSAGLDAARALASIGEAALPALETTFRVDHAPARRHAANAMALMGGAGVVTLSVHAEDERPAWRRAAIHALAGQAAPSPAVHATLHRATRDGDASTRLFALGGLTRVWKEHAVRFVAALRDRDPRIRKLAADTLREGDYRGHPVRENLLRALELDLVADHHEALAATVRATLELELATPQGSDPRTRKCGTGAARSRPSVRRQARRRSWPEARPPTSSRWRR